MTCKVITFEGGDCVGKETQSKLLVQYLNDNGHRAVRVEMPWPDSSTHGWIRRMLANGTAKRWPYAFQALQLVNKLHFQYTLMKTLLKSHEFIVLDRWDASMWVYGRVTGVDTWTLQAMMNRVHTPDVRILLRGMSYKREAEDSYERDHELQSRVRESYDKFAAAAGMWPVDANQSIEKVHSDIVRVLDCVGVYEHVV